MERKVFQHFMKWKKDASRKPLVIYGSKQVGKTYSVLKFGEEEYENVVYFNADNNLPLLEVLKKEKTIDRIITSLSALSNEVILKDDTLVIIDNVNEIEIVNAIKTFGKFPNDYHIIIITSLRENLSKFKGEELQFKSILPMDFEEYLIAINNSQLIDFIRLSFKNNTRMPFHQLTMEYYEKYLSVGGMPEAVASSVSDNNILLLNSISSKIIDTYKKEISIQDNLIDITRSIEVYDSIPYQLQKINRKFQYGLIKNGGRSKEYEHALSFLHNNGFVYKCYKVSDIKSPLSSCKDKDSFKVYLNDTGLLWNKMHLNNSKFDNDLNIRNILYENSIAINIINSGYGLFYYQSEGKAEINFVIQNRMGKIIPIELADRTVTRSKALTLFMNKFNIDEAIKVTEDNFHVKKGVKYIPVYALFCLGDIM